VASQPHAGTSSAERVQYFVELWTAAGALPTCSCLFVYLCNRTAPPFSAEPVKASPRLHVERYAQSLSVTSVPVGAAVPAVKEHVRERCVEVTLVPIVITPSIAM
jgi:hypothetical protein